MRADEQKSVQSTERQSDKNTKGSLLYRMRETILEMRTQGNAEETGGERERRKCRKRKARRR